MIPYSVHPADFIPQLIPQLIPWLIPWHYCQLYSSIPL